MIDDGNCTVDAIDTYQQYRKSSIKIPEGCGSLRKKVIWLLPQNGVPKFFFCCLYCGVGWQKIMQCSSNLQFHRGGWLCLDTGLHLRFALLSCSLFAFLMYLRRYVAKCHSRGMSWCFPLSLHMDERLRDANWHADLCIGKSTICIHCTIVRYWSRFEGLSLSIFLEMKWFKV